MKIVDCVAIVICAGPCWPVFSQSAVTTQNRLRETTPCEARTIMNKIKDVALAKAIQESRETLPDFIAAFHKRARAQTDFMVTVLEDNGDAYVPVGILVDKVDEELISGRSVANTLLCEPREPMSGPLSGVVDWRYTDAFEMVGGALYRQLYASQHRCVQFTIRDEQPFLIGREKEIDPDLLGLFRNIANGRNDCLKQLQKDQLSMSGLTAEMPMFTDTGGRKVEVYPWTIPEYTARFGDRDAIDFLFEQGVLLEDSGKYCPLADSSSGGNLETTIRLLELGFDVNGLDELDNSPLHLAAMRNQVEIARRLIEYGADCNFRDRDEATPLFHVVSPEFAELLVKAGADVHAVKDNGETCVVGHLLHRRMDIVKVLVDAGARVDDEIRESYEDNPAVLKELLREYLFDRGDGETLEEFAIAESVDFGCVLPVRSLPKSISDGNDGVRSK